MWNRAKKDESVDDMCEYVCVCASCGKVFVIESVTASGNVRAIWKSALICVQYSNRSYLALIIELCIDIG